MSAGDWYYLDGATYAGPVTWEALQGLATTGAIGVATWVWRQGTDRWVAFGDLMGPEASAPPPLPPDAVGQGAAIVVADGWTASPPRPWRRFLARLVDVAVNGLAGFLLLGVAGYALAPVTTDRLLAYLDTPIGGLADTFLTVLVSLPLTAAFVGLTGSSAGKWLFGLKVVGTDGRLVGVGRALRRELRIWPAGLGLGIPIAAVVTMTFAFSRLRERGAASWDDAGGTVVLYGRFGPVHTLLAVLCVALILFALAVLNADAMARPQ